MVSGIAGFLFLRHHSPITCRGELALHFRRHTLCGVQWIEWFCVRDEARTAETCILTLKSVRSECQPWSISDTCLIACGCFHLHEIEASLLCWVSAQKCSTTEEHPDRLEHWAAYVQSQDSREPHPRCSMFALLSDRHSYPRESSLQRSYRGSPGLSWGLKTGVSLGSLRSLPHLSF